MKILIIFVTVWLLTGCVDTSAVIVCPVQVQPWTKTEQLQGLVEEEKLPQGSILRTWIEDYATMRDQARACKPNP